MTLAAWLGPLGEQRCFVVYRLAPKAGTWKSDKIPVTPAGQNSDAQNPHTWLTLAEAQAAADALGAAHGVGIVLHTALKVACVDVDDCLQADGQWSPLAVRTCARFPGAAIEISPSGRGLHVFFTIRDRRAHSVKNVLLGLEAYDDLRFIAITGTGATGSWATDCTEAYDQLLVEHFPPRPVTDRNQEWTDKPVPQWHGPLDDAELVNRALRSQSPAAIFGGKVSFLHLWQGDAGRLGAAYPSAKGDAWDRSSADQAFFNHLCFWTGGDCERMARIAWQCPAMVRDKWQREDYFKGSILDSCATQRQWYNDGQAPTGAVPASDPPAAIAAQPVQAVPLAAPVALAQPAVTVSAVSAVAQAIVVPEKLTLQPGEIAPPGSTLFLQEQQAMFTGCMYVEDLCQILMPEGVLLDKARFDNRFPGITFSVTGDGTKPTMSAWDAFVQSQVFSFPKVRGLYFAPTEPAGAVVWKDGMQFINSWVPQDIPCEAGDYSPFWAHLKKILPNGQDAEILFYYMAAMVQNQGTKFQWAPYIQGVEGNGKSIICDAMEHCIGSRYTHMGNAAKLGSEHNAELYGKIFLRFDEVKIDQNKRADVWETLKNMVTAAKLEIRAMYTDKVTREVCFNIIMLSNHKNGIRKTRNDRRLCTLFCAQQSLADLLRDGLVDDIAGQHSAYFNQLWDWCNNGGWAKINWALRNVVIPAQFNPAGECRRAPDTTSTLDAIMQGMGMAEQELLEAIGVGLDGFRGGWVSSDALDILLARVGKGSAIPRQQRPGLLQALGYSTHPALGESGRITTRMPNGSRPVLYLKVGHAALGLGSQKEVVDAFTKAQKDMG